MAADNEINVKFGATTDELKSKLDEAASSISRATETMSQQAERAYGKLSDAQKQFYASLDAEIEAERKANAAAYELAHAHDTLSDSMEKVGHSSVRTRREMMVMAHEAVQGNIKNLGGSFMVLMESTGGFTGALQALGGALLGPVGAAVALSGAVVGVALAAARAAAETEHMNTMIGMTNGYSGQTAESLDAMARNIAKSSSSSVGSIHDIQMALVQNGKVGAAAFEEVTKAAEMYSRVTGKTADESVAFLSKTFTDPAKGARDLDAQFHYLSQTQLDYIQHIQNTQGAQEAMAESARLLRQHLAEIAPPLTNLDVILQAVASDWGVVKKAMENAFVPTEAAKMVEIQREIDHLNRSIAAGYPVDHKYLEELKAQIAAIHQRNAAEQHERDVKAAKQAGQEELKNAIAISRAYDDTQAKVDKITANIKTMQDQLRKAGESKGNDSQVAQISAGLVKAQEELDKLQNPQEKKQKAAGHEKSKIPEMEEQLRIQQLAMIKNQGRQMEMSEEIAFWEKQKALATTSKDDRVAIERKLASERLAEAVKGLKDQEKAQKDADKLALDMAKAKAEALHKINLDEIAAKEAIVKQAAAMGQIDENEQLARIKTLEQQKTEIDVKNTQVLRESYAKNTVEYQKMTDQIEAIKRAGAAKVTEIDNKMAVNTRKEWMDMVAPVKDALDAAVTGVIQGTTSIQKAFANMAQSIGLEITKMIIKSNLDLAASKLFGIIGPGAGAGGGAPGAGGGGAAGGGGIGGMFGGILGNIFGGGIEGIGGKIGVNLPSVIGGAGAGSSSGGGAGSSVNVTNNFLLSGPIDRGTQSQIAFDASSAIQAAVRSLG